VSDPRDDLILRHGNASRVAHWAVALVFLVLFASGLALFHPFFYWLTALIGGGPLARFLHPLAGVALVLIFTPYAVGHLHDNRWLPADSAWLRSMASYMRNEDPDVGQTGKYNAGQKLMFWSMLPIIAVLAVTGLTLWQPWLAPAFTAGTRRLTGLIHVVAAFIMFVGIGIHVYAAIWTRGSIHAMVRGTVTRAWARFHYPGWYREITGRSDR